MSVIWEMNADANNNTIAMAKNLTMVGRYMQSVQKYFLFPFEWPFGAKFQVSAIYDKLYMIHCCELYEFDAFNARTRQRSQSQNGITG